MRNLKLDNFRFLLIFLVVFGHFLELLNGAAKNSLYIIIYSFHMPAFIFITGYFSSFNPLKTFTNFIYPYLIFQILYILFDAFLINPASSFLLQFTTPYWLLWYLPVCAIYTLLIPVIPKKSMALKLFFLSGTAAISLVAGYFDKIGYYLSLSRLITFFPFFALGFMAKNKTNSCIITSPKSRKACIFIASFLLAVMLYCLLKSGVTPHTLYGSYPYSALNYGAIQRGSYLLIAFLWIIILYHFIPNKKIPMVTSIGQNTLPIYLLHGFIIKLATVFDFSKEINLFTSLFLTLLILIVFGNSFFAKKFRLLFTGKWIERFFYKKTT